MLKTVRVNLTLILVVLATLAVVCIFRWDWLKTNLPTIILITTFILIPLSKRARETKDAIDTQALARSQAEKKQQDEMKAQTDMLKALMGTEKNPGALARISALEKEIKELVTMEVFQKLRVEFDDLRDSLCKG